jgi:hypothetical protein
MDMETIVLLIVGASALVMAGVGVYIAGKPANVGWNAGIHRCGVDRH